LIISIELISEFKERNLVKTPLTDYTFKPQKSFLLKKFDGNIEKFDQLVVKHCNVYQLNRTIECLKKLEEFDTKKVSFVFDDKKENYIYYYTFWQPVSSKSYHLRVMKLNILSYLATLLKKISVINAFIDI
jgi:glutaredoxin 2